MVLKKGIWSRYSTDGTEYAEDRPYKRFSSSEYALGSAQLELPEWLGVPLRQIPPEYEFVLANFNTSAVPHSCLRVYNYSKGLSDRNRLAGGSQLISKFLREIEPTVSQFLNVHAFRK